MIIRCAHEIQWVGFVSAQFLYLSVSSHVFKSAAAPQIFLFPFVYYYFLARCRLYLFSLSFFRHFLIIFFLFYPFVMSLLFFLKFLFVPFFFGLLTDSENGLKLHNCFLVFRSRCKLTLSSYCTINPTQRIWLSPNTTVSTVVAASLSVAVLFLDGPPLVR